MQVPVQITFRDVKHSAEVSDHIHQKVDKLNQLTDMLISCHVVVEFACKHQQSGNLYSVRVVVNAPNKELVSTHNHDENMYVAIREAFDDITRQIEEYSQIHHGRKKRHPQLLDGQVVRVFDAGYGFIAAENGEEYYYNTDNVVHPKGSLLAVGSHVHFIEYMGDEGLQAHRVSMHRRDLGEN